MNELKRNRGQGILMVIRITVEAACAFFLTAALLHYGAASTAIGREIIGAQPEVAVFGLVLTVLTVWLVVTLFFGRIYCSTLCPLGALMDLAGRARPRGKVYRYRRPLTALRLAILVGVMLLIAAGYVFPREWMLPFALYQTLVERLTHPQVAAATIVALIVSVFIVAVAFKSGRLLCNTLCPVGSILGLLSRRALFHIDINTDRCTQCRRCVDVCKSACIDLNDHVVDMSRCVVCFDCLPECADDAITYTLGRHTLSDPLMMPKYKSFKKDETIS